MGGIPHGSSPWGGGPFPKFLNDGKGLRPAWTRDRPGSKDPDPGFVDPDPDQKFIRIRIRIQHFSESEKSQDL